MNLGFQMPWALPALALPIAFAAWRLFRRSRGAGVKFSAVARIPQRGGGWRRALAGAAPYMMVAGLVSLAVAAARPRVPLGNERKNVDAIAIVMAVDVSGSMNFLDLTPRGKRESRDTTRLAIVKKTFADFVSYRPDDLIGLVTFGGYASTRAPLTADHESLLNVLKAVEIPNAEDEQMTAIGDGLSVALLRLKDAKPKSKIVILLSDGMCNVGAVSPEQAADTAAKMGVKVYSIGVGTGARVAKRLVQDGYGRDVVVLDRSGFDEAQLRGIAKKTGGRYFAVNDRDALDKAMEEIDKLETTPMEAEVWNRWREYFPQFLSVGALLVVLAVASSVAATRRMA